MRRWDGTKWPLAAGVLIVTMTLGAGHAYAAPPHHTPHHRRGARVHAANIICPSVRKIHWFDNLCGYGGGMGSPTAFGMGFNMEGWLPGQLGWLRPRLAPIGPRNLESLIGYLHGMVATKNRKAPYDWAKDAGGSKIKAAAATCLLAGVTAATAQSIFT